MSRPSNTMREALVAQALEEIDAAISRIEGLGVSVDEWDNKLAKISIQLNEASDKYLMAVTAFTEQAKNDLTEHIQRKGAETVRLTEEGLLSAMQEAARLAFRSQASDEAGKLTDKLRIAAKELRHNRSSRNTETAFVAISATLITLAFVKFFF